MEIGSFKRPAHTWESLPEAARGTLQPILDYRETGIEVVLVFCNVQNTQTQVLRTPLNNIDEAYSDLKWGFQTVQFNNFSDVSQIALLNSESAKFKGDPDPSPVAVMRNSISYITYVRQERGGPLQPLRISHI